MRLGKIKISDRLLDRRDPSSLCEAFSKLKLFPVRCEHNYCTGAFEIAGISPMFDDVPDAQIPPDYEVAVVTDENGGLVNVSVKRIS